MIATPDEASLRQSRPGCPTACQRLRTIWHETVGAFFQIAATIPYHSLVHLLVGPMLLVQLVVSLINIYIRVVVFAATILQEYGIAKPKVTAASVGYYII